MDLAQCSAVQKLGEIFAYSSCQKFRTGNKVAGQCEVVAFDGGNFEGFVPRMALIEQRLLEHTAPVFVKTRHYNRILKQLAQGLGAHLMNRMIGTCDKDHVISLKDLDLEAGKFRGVGEITDKDVDALIQKPPQRVLVRSDVNSYPEVREVLHQRQHRRLYDTARGKVTASDRQCAPGISYLIDVAPKPIYLDDEVAAPGNDFTPNRCYNKAPAGPFENLCPQVRFGLLDQTGQSGFGHLQLVGSIAKLLQIGEGNNGQHCLIVDDIRLPPLQNLKQHDQLYETHVNTFAESYTRL